MSKKPVRVAVTGAAGQIGYALLFRIASGEMLGKDQPVILQLLEIPDEKAQKALKGVMMELQDCAFPLLAGMEAHADPMTAFKDTDYALLVGARPRGRQWTAGRAAGLAGGSLCRGGALSAGCAGRADRGHDRLFDRAGNGQCITGRRAHSHDPDPGGSGYERPCLSKTNQTHWPRVQQSRG